MDKKDLKERCRKLEIMKEGKEQDTLELDFVIKGLKHQLEKFK